MGMMHTLGTVLLLWNPGINLPSFWKYSDSQLSSDPKKSSSVQRSTIRRLCSPQNCKNLSKKKLSLTPWGEIHREITDCYLCIPSGHLSLSQESSNQSRWFKISPQLELPYLTGQGCYVWENCLWLSLWGLRQSLCNHWYILLYLDLMSQAN